MDDPVSYTHLDVYKRQVIFHLGDLEMITIPGELFSTFGMEIKKNFNAPMRIVWGYANYSAGYIVEKDEFGKGYESMQTPFLQGCLLYTSFIPPIGLPEAGTRITPFFTIFLKTSNV